MFTTAAANPHRPTSAGPPDPAEPVSEAGRRVSEAAYWDDWYHRDDIL